MKVAEWVIGTVLSAVLGAASAQGFETVRAEEYCRLPSYKPALRQTMVLIDENEIAANPEGGVAEANRDLLRLISSFADPDESRRAGTFLPREEVTVYVLPRDGAEPEQIFVGCQPFFSEEEERADASEQGSLAKAMRDFFGQGAVNEAQDYVRTFTSGLLRALVEAGRPENLSATGAEGAKLLESGVVQSLRRASRIVNLEYGIPRIVLLSDLTRYSPAIPNDIATAREQGFAAARDAQLNFNRAELYVIGVPGSAQAELAREFAHAFFLGSGAWLSGWSHKTIGNMAPNPTTVQIYNGIIHYSSETDEVPMQMRVAYDRNGVLVNSWIGLQGRNVSDLLGRKDSATPLSGSVVCESDSKCEGKGDGTGFSQAWSLNPSADQELYRPGLPFGGLRYFEFAVLNSEAKGRIYDPHVERVGSQEHLPFELRLVENGRY
jgi:hypothetical protein